MNCEIAEENLSAYLDDMLDPPDRATLQTHLDGCVHCREILDDYRRYDALLRYLPRVAPPDELRAQIFESPAFLELVRDQQRDQERQQERASANGAGPHSGRRLATAPPRRRMIGLQAAIAAAVVLAIGTALLVRQGLFTSQHRAGVTTSTIGNPGTGVPLAAGNRLVFIRGDALWSAPEAGPGLAQQLTPKGVDVAAFAVSPDGHFVAYIDGSHGALHVIRSDDQSDTTIVAGHGLQILSAPVWSPDGQQIAYAVNSASGPALHLVNSNGTNNRVVASSSSGAVSSFGRMVWSADALHIAWVQTTSGAENLWAYDLVTHQARQLAAQADPTVSGARFGRLVWLPDPLHPALSWAADAFTPPTPNSGPSAMVSGVFTLALSSGSVQRLTPAGATYEFAQFTAARGDGVWLLVSADSGSSSTVQAIAAGSGASLVTTTVPASVTNLGFWSPDGSRVAFATTAGDLMLWTPGGAAPAVVLHGVTGMGIPMWSPDGSHLVVPTSGGVVSVAVSGGTSTKLSGATGQGVAAFWAPDGQAVVVVSPSGISIVASDGTQSRVVAQVLVSGTPLEWSVAG